MHRPSRAAGAHASGSRRLRFWAAALSAGLAGVALAALAGIAIAKVTTLGVAKNVKVGTKTENVVVDSHGITVYTLSDETTKPHVKLTCTKASGCFAFWFPVTVHSASTKLTAASGIKGKLGMLHRNGFFQVTLGGKPLYTFKFDATNGKPVKGKATGEGVPSFGGVWHVIAAASSSHAQTHTTTTTTTSTNPYGY
jgi:predicted lipoprotein with Yx(FWY)xxD motif